MHRVRSEANKGNKVVFGLATTFTTFALAFLRDDRKAFATKLLDWVDDKDKLVSM